MQSRCGTQSDSEENMNVEKSKPNDFSELQIDSQNLFDPSQLYGINTRCAPPTAEEDEDYDQMILSAEMRKLLLLERKIEL
jgi:hypothetical protein